MRTLTRAARILIVATAAASAAANAAPTFELTSAVELVLPGVASSEFSDIRLAASPDGRTVLWGSTNRPGGPGGWDIWLARKGATGWSAPEAAPFNTSSKEFDPVYSPDGRMVYFFSNRPGGRGGDDLYRVPVTDAGFGAVENLGPQVNSAGDEWAPSPSPDGKTLLFATNGRGGAGRHDLFLSPIEGAGFGAARALQGAINTPLDDFDAAFLPDGRSLVFSRSTDVENAPVALYFATSGSQGYDAGTLLSPAINLEGGDAFAPTLDWADPTILYFSSHRTDATAGKTDHYRVRFRVRR